MVYRDIGIVLNLDNSIDSLQDLQQASRSGLSRDAIAKVREVLDISVSQLAEFLHVSERTLQRYLQEKTDKLLSVDISDRLLQLIKVYLRAVEVFEDENNALAWLKHPCRALGDELPINLLDTFSGIEIVSNELIRIEYGVVA